MGIACRQEGMPGKISHKLALLTLDFIEFGKELTLENFFFPGQTRYGGEGCGKVEVL